MSGLVVGRRGHLVALRKAGPQSALVGLRFAYPTYGYEAQSAPNIAREVRTLIAGVADAVGQIARLGT